MPAPYNILTNSTADGTSSYVTVDESGRYSLEAEGTWNGASLSFLFKGAQKRNAIALSDALGASVSFTADGARGLYIAKGQQIAAVQATSGGSTSLSVTLLKVQN